MVPPLGAIIVGPCPECQELVVVFCGHVLPLEKEIMLNGTSVARHEHLMSGIMEFLGDRIEKLVEESSESAEGVASHHFSNDVTGVSGIDGGGLDETISEDEVARFRSTELQLIDNKEYFELFFS